MNTNPRPEMSTHNTERPRQGRHAPLNPLYYAVTALLIAVTTVFTLLIRIPIPATQGYINFSDVATYFAGFSFGAVTGGLAGGIGAAIADLLGGYAQFAPLTLLAHGIQGLLAGFIGRKGSIYRFILGWAAGTIAMVGIYFFGEGLIYTTFANALVELPFNLLQNVAGGIIGIPLYYAVRKAYPAIIQLDNRDVAVRK